MAKLTPHPHVAYWLNAIESDKELLKTIMLRTKTNREGLIAKVATLYNEGRPDDRRLTADQLILGHSRCEVSPTTQCVYVCDSDNCIFCEKCMPHGYEDRLVFRED